MALVVITGGTSGIGLGLAERFADKNFEVIVTGRNEDKFLKNRVNPKIRFLKCDVTNEKEVNFFANSVSLDYKGVEILINNAGLGVVKPISETTLEEWNLTLQTNLTGTFLTTKAFLPLLENSENSHIFNINSVAGKVAFPSWASYCASKFGLTGFTNALREELRPKKIRVTSVFPGAINTDFWNSVEGDFPREKMMTPEDVFGAIYSAYTTHPRALVEEISIGLAGGVL
ncbi:MAG: SDR family NAD(P)-dependent oxidoreductase [Calditrichaeota bacterium]|nr:MAG: SDR family NAD(P)-dependent oxidoreductase [Calditrichota bacterium]